jgi:hypothetical protein
MIKKILVTGLCATIKMGAQSAPTFLYSHGLFDNHTQAYWFAKTTPQGVENKRYIMNGEIVTFDYLDVSPWFWRTDFTQVSVGQTNEVLRLKEIFQTTQSLLELEGRNTDMVLVGVSRGASVIINYMGIFNPESVKALVLEAPFDSTATIAKSMVKNLKLSWIPGMKTMSHNFLTFLFMQHKKDGIQPIDSVPLIKKDLPIFLSCSHDDWVVPASSTIALYKKLLETGHTHVYLFISQKSKHSKIIFGEDGDDYTQAIHAFYKKYDIDHDPLLAVQGQAILARCQPPIAKLQKLLK